MLSTRLAWVMVLAAPAAGAATIDVAPGQKIADAVAAAKPGDKIVVAAGSYAESLTLDGSGGSSQPITISAAGAVLNGTLTLEGDHWVIEGLEIQPGSGTDAVRVKGNHNTFDGIEIHGGTRDGIDGGGTGNKVLNSKIHNLDAGDSDAHCIVLNPGATDWVISDNQLFDCSGDSIQLYASGAERTIKNVQISNNEMYWSGAIGRMENAVDIKNADGLLVAGNRMYGFIENKTIVFQKGPANVEVRCNVMSDGFTGVEFRSEDGGTLEKVRFVRNLMYGFSSYALKFDDVHEASVYNNTFVDIQSDGLRIEGGGLHSGDIKNNLWVNTGSVEPSSATAGYNGFFNAKNQLAGSNDVSADPMLDSAYQLGAGSPMIDAGTDVGLPFTGSAPDIGFFELGSDDACSAPAGGGSGGAAGSGGSAPGSGGGSSGGDGGTSGGGGGSGAAGAGASGADDDGSSEEGGCACRTVAPAQTGGLAWLSLALALAFIRRRRRH